MLSTVTAVVLYLTRDKDLKINIDIRPSSFACDLFSVRKGGIGSVSPARATKLKNVLATHIRQAIDTFDVDPIPSFKNRVNWDERRVHPGLGNDFRLDTASMIE